MNGTLTSALSHGDGPAIATPTMSQSSPLKSGAKTQDSCATMTSYMSLKAVTIAIILSFLFHQI